MDHLRVKKGIGVGVEDGRVAMLACDEDLIEWVREAGPFPVVDCGQRLITPGLVDCHTHAVFGKPRLDDQARRARGEDYKAIAAAGGGILSSVADFRGRGEDELVALTRNRLALLGALGSRSEERRVGKECRL